MEEDETELLLLVVDGCEHAFACLLAIVDRPTSCTSLLVQHCEFIGNGGWLSRSVNPDMEEFVQESAGAEDEVIL